MKVQAFWPLIEVLFVICGIGKMSNGLVFEPESVLSQFAGVASIPWPAEDLTAPADLLNMFLILVGLRLVTVTPNKIFNVDETGITVVQ